MAVFERKILVEKFDLYHKLLYCDKCNRYFKPSDYSKQPESTLLIKIKLVLMDIAQDIFDYPDCLTKLFNKS